MKLTKQQAIAFEYLSHNFGEWISPGIIGAEIYKQLKKGSGHSSTGSPVCKKLVSLGLAERNKKGYYRLLVL